ncbi:hypothetical protein Cgig2_017475 [Carnegiea gigantea]|uniref:Uncharacterized protein n=1 Tax=Carnegiea gigantea TaxID=171969 RepID=A0A9Q1GPU7_9CARY|nr:hypothetical protein Cgig2_017475 [Carnegiea gigantea]
MIPGKKAWQRQYKTGGGVSGGAWEGVGVKGKGKVEEIKRRSRNHEGEDGSREQAVDVVVRHHCAFDAVCALNDQLSEIQKEAISEMVWSPVLEYKTFAMDRYMVQGLLEVWNPERLPATGKHIAFERSDGSSEVEEVLKEAMEKRVSRERQRRRTVQKAIRIYRNYMSVWFYEHSSIYAFTDEKRVPRLSSWVNFYQSKKYDPTFVVPELKDSKKLIETEEYNAYVEDALHGGRLTEGGDALLKEREAHAKEKEAHKLDELKEVTTLNTVVEDILEFVRRQWFNSAPDALELKGVREEGTNSDVCSLETDV